MRILFTASLTSLLLGSLCAPAFSQVVEINYSEDAQKKFSEEYGEREQPILEDYLRKKILAAVSQNNLQVSRIQFLIEDISPNHPTREQAIKTPGLDQFSSVSIGGAQISSTAYGANDQVIAQVSINRFSHSIRDAQYGSTWTDAKQALYAISNRLAKDITEKG